jgi:DNA-binding CsgD family transcriptional regulator
MVPLVRAAELGFDLVSEIESVTRHFGFDSFMYGVAVSPVPDHDSCIYIFTTMPMEWVIRYDQMAYVEVDPRVAEAWDRTVPLVWDQVSARGRSVATDAFLDDAKAHGIASGVGLPLHDETGTRILVAFNSSVAILTKERRQRIANDLGEMVIFANYFHEIFMKGVVARGIPTKVTGMRLSLRERECLQLAAGGLTTDAIAKRLGIASRTAQFHFDSIRSKLGAANRHEAIARAIRQGQISS